MDGPNSYFFFLLLSSSLPSFLFRLRCKNEARSTACGGVSRGFLFRYRGRRNEILMRWYSFDFLFSPPAPLTRSNAGNIWIAKKKKVRPIHPYATRPYKPWPSILSATVQNFFLFSWKFVQHVCAGIYMQTVLLPPLVSSTVFSSFKKKKKKKSQKKSQHIQ